MLLLVVLSSDAMISRAQKLRPHALPFLLMMLHLFNGDRVALFINVFFSIDMVQCLKNAHIFAYYDLYSNFS